MQTITIQNLSKTYETGKEAVKNLSLSLQAGEVFGFLGPNGAGKTTTVKLLTGILTPTSGTCRVFDLNPQTEANRVHAVSGIVTEHAQMYDHLTAMENLMFYASTFGINRSEAKKRSETLLAEFELTDAKDQKLASFSTGMRQRLSLARALIHRPSILFLDEPTSGLDPENAQRVHQMIRKLASEEHIAVFLCTHQLRYAQEVCTRYGLMDEGTLLVTGTLEELRTSTFSGQTLSIRADRLPAGLPFVSCGDSFYTTSIRSEQEIPDLIRTLVVQGVNLYEVSVKKPSLEDIYFALTAKQTEGF